MAKNINKSIVADNNSSINNSNLNFKNKFDKKSGILGALAGILLSLISSLIWDFGLKDFIENLFQ